MSLHTRCVFRCLPAVASIYCPFLTPVVSICGHSGCNLSHDWYVQSLLKVAIHGGGGATRPDQGRAVQFEGHWIARPNPGRQRAGGAAGAGAE